MRVSRRHLYQLIKEEILEALEYPADEMAAITATIFSLADHAGVNVDGDARDVMIDELEDALAAEGYELHEQNLVLGDRLRLDLEGTTLLALIVDIGDTLPGAWNKIIKAFERGGIDVSDIPHPSYELPEPEALPPAEPEKPPKEKPEKPPKEKPKEGDEEDSWLKDLFGFDDDDDDDSWLKKIFGPDDDEEETTLDEPSGLPQPPDAEDPEEPEEPEDKFKNPWGFKWFWEEEEDEEDQPGWMKKAVTGLKGMLGGGSTSIKVVGGLTGVAGIVGLLKYLANDEEKIDEAAALKKGEDLKDLGTVAPANHWAFVPETLKFILSLTLDKEQMKTVETVEEVIRLGLVFVHSDDPKRQKEIDASIYKALDQVPGIEWIDKLPGGRERIVEIIRERWMEMSTKDKISFIVALLPQDVVERLEALIPGPELQRMDMRWPEVMEELNDWFMEAESNLKLNDNPALVELLFGAGEMFGLLDPAQTEKAIEILKFTDEALIDAKDDSNIERMMKIMDVLFEHKKQLSRMKVLAGVK